MVGYKPNNQVKRPDSDYVIAGAASGFITRTIFQPLDVLKIRFQLQVEPIRKISSSKYWNTRQAFRMIRKEEGLKAFWKGTTPAQILSISYSSLQFLSFELITEEAYDLLPENTYDRIKPFMNFTCGSIAGCIATTGSMPFDVIRTRLVSQGEPKTYRGMFHAAWLMLRNEGASSFYKGLVPTLIQIVPHTGAQFAFYKLFHEIWEDRVKRNLKKERSVKKKSGVMQNSFSGAAAGIMAKTVIYPLDLIKKRIQVQGFEEARKSFGICRRYLGLYHCITCILAEEGLLGFYKGLLPSVLKAAFTTASHFMFYEEVLEILEEIPR